MFPVAVALNPVETENGPAVIATIVDLTEQRRLERDYRMARGIQQALLPEAVPLLDELSGYDVAGQSEPAEAAGGDFFDYLVLPEGQFGVVLGDVSGHGFPAAILAAATTAYVRALALAYPYPPRLLGTLDRLLYEHSPESTFVTMALMTLHPPSGRVTFAGGGHCGWWVRRGGTATQLRATGPPLGCVEAARHSSAVDFSLEAGEGVVMLSDGVADARAADGSRFGNHRVFAILEQHWHEPAARLVNRLIASAREFGDPDRPREDTDDMTAVVVRRIESVE
jgi:serine phosphatase RsbU (regulator of sigma subunit)